MDIPKVIQERISALEKEVRDSRDYLERANMEVNRVTTEIISKKGAVIELKKIIVKGKDKKENGNDKNSKRSDGKDRDTSAK